MVRALSRRSDLEVLRLGAALELILPKKSYLLAAVLLAAPALALAADPPSPVVRLAAALSAPSDTYLALREVAFSTRSEDVEVKVTPGQEQAYGVIVEFRRDAAMVTVVGFASGDSSVYLSTGGGLIGGRREPLVAAAAQSLVARAQLQLADLPLVKTYPTPDQGDVRVYVLTTAGLRGVEVARSQIETAHHPLNLLYADAQKIMSEFRTARP